jgi:F0F1-type ATP synthase delta subunit
MIEPINPLVFYTFIKTRDEAITFQEKLKLVSTDLFKGDKKIEEAIAARLPYGKIVMIQTIAEKYTIDQNNTSDMQELFLRINEAIDTLPLAHLIIAIDPSVQTIHAIHQWFYRTLKKATVIDIDVDPSLIGGSIISFNGKLRDYSLKRLLMNELINENIKAKS